MSTTANLSLQPADIAKLRAYMIDRIEKHANGRILSEKEIANLAEQLFKRVNAPISEDVKRELFQEILEKIQQRAQQKAGQTAAPAPANTIQARMQQHAQKEATSLPPSMAAEPDPVAQASEPAPAPVVSPVPVPVAAPVPTPVAAPVPAPVTAPPPAQASASGDEPQFGVIQVLLDDPDVSEVMVNGPDNIYVEKNGQLQKAPVTFADNAAIERVINNIITPLGRFVDEDHPTVDARLPDGSRVNAVIKPVAIDGASITIRKFAKERLGISNLVDFKSLNNEMAEFLEACVAAHLNIVVSGGTGSGKTTLLNILSSFIPDQERIVTIEDAAELQMQQDHVVRLETKAANRQGTGEVTIRDLVKNSLRMRPDRIIIGEIRGGEALDMLQAMNTGHDGSLTTVHSNNPRDAVARLETLVLMAGMDLPLNIVRQQIASAVDLIVQASRLSDGSRKVTYITEIAGMEGDRVIMTDVFKFEKEGTTADGKVIGDHIPSGIRPNFMERLIASGHNLSPSIFMPKRK